MVIARAAPKVIPDDTAYPLFMSASFLSFYVAPQRSCREAGQARSQKKERKRFFGHERAQMVANKKEKHCTVLISIRANSCQFAAAKVLASSISVNPCRLVPPWRYWASVAKVYYFLNSVSSVAKKLNVKDSFDSPRQQ